MVLKDGCGRPLLNLRMAITNKCNIDCSFCHAEGEEQENRNSNEMTVDEIVRIAKIATALGIRKVKLTGGEPLTRKDIAEIVSGLSALRDLSELSMTTNGTLLESLAKKLRANGLQRVNINLPTIKPEIYHKITGGMVEDALAGVASAVEAGFFPVKLNMLILNGVNDYAVPEMIDLARETGAILQLIELEPVNTDETYYSVHHKSLDQYEDMLKETALQVETRKYMQNRRVYHLPDVMVEVVRPIDNTEFCMNCTRLRVTSDGKLKPCLMRNDNLVDVLTPLRKGADDQELVDLFKFANERRLPFNNGSRNTRKYCPA